MIIHELKHELKTSVRCASRYPSCDHDMRIDKRSEGSPLRDERYVNKLSNLLCLTECGFYDRLEEGGLVGPNMDT